MNMKLLIITSHLSTGGAPQYLLEYLKTFHQDYSEIKIVEVTNFSHIYNIQKDKIRDFVGQDNLVCLGEYGADETTWYTDKMKLPKIIDVYGPDVIWMNEFPENYEYKPVPNDMVEYIYREDRNYKIIETTHYNAFDFNNKRFFGDEMMFCSPFHMDKSEFIEHKFPNIKRWVWEIPIDIKIRPDRSATLESLGLDPSYFHILNVGLMNSNKNQKYIFELASQMKKDKVMFHFIGNDCFLNQCDISDDQLNLSNCKIWGERSDVDIFMSCMDMYLFPSKKELNPITVIEALSNDMKYVIVNRDEYVSQYEEYDNFYILDDVINIEYMIQLELKKFLIVCSVYNKEEDQIKRTIDNLINQTYTNWTLIISDDFSTNNSKEVIIEYIKELNDDRIHYYDIEYKYELYLYQNFFKSMDYDYYFDLDSDDILDEDILNIYQKHFIKYPNVNSIFCDYKVIDQEGKLQRYGLVKPSIDLIEDFNIRTYSSYLKIWEHRSSWSMFGVGRCFRRSEFDCFEIDKRCKTATDSMVLFNSILEGDHLHIPINLYTYERRENSDSFVSLTHEEYENYNVNTLKALEKYSMTDNKMADIYGDIYLETSAIILSGFKDDISLLTNISNEQLKKLNFLYNGKVKVNDLSCKNIIIITNKIDNIPTFDDKNVSIYRFFDDFNIEEEQLENYFNEEREKLTQNVNFDRYFHYFRHFISHKDMSVKKLKHNNMIENNIDITEFEGIKVEITGDIQEDYLIEFINMDINKTIFSDTISNNMWTKPNIKYFINWQIKINGDIVYEQDLKGKRVLIEFGSSSLGDTIAWFPYLSDFKKKHECEIVVLTFKNWLFENLDMYNEFEFIKPGDMYHNINKKYDIGWFLDINGNIDMDHCPTNFRTIPLQQTATDILGLEPYQLRPSIDMKYTNKSPMDKKYVCIAIHSTAQAKYWNNPNGWQQTVDYLKNSGYEVVLISKEEDGYMGNKHPKGISQIDGDLNEISNYLEHCDFFIGISSGISWLAWAIETPMVLISGFSEPYTEFNGNDIERVVNEDVCHGCFNAHKLDPSDWNWCPLHKGTNEQFECTKNITYRQVNNSIKKIIEYIKNET